MEIKVGDVIRSVWDGVEFTVNKLLNEWAVIESQDGKRKVVTGVDTLQNKSFYKKKEEAEG